MSDSDYITEDFGDNAANAISKLKCKRCGKTNQWSVGRKLHGGTEDRLYLECKCGAHTHVYLHPNVDIDVGDWW